MSVTSTTLTTVTTTSTTTTLPPLSLQQSINLYNVSVAWLRYIDPFGNDYTNFTVTTSFYGNNTFNASNAWVGIGLNSQPLMVNTNKIHLFRKKTLFFHLVYFFCFVSH